MNKILVAIIALLVAQVGNTAEVKEWTLLVFMNAHGQAGDPTDLSPFAQKNLQWMQSVGSNDEINIVAEVGTNANADAQRVFVGKNNIQTIQNISNANMGSSEELLNFIRWAVQNYPAKHYFIDIWNHGMGWHAFGPGEDASGKWKPGPGLTNDHIQKINDISFDFDTQNFISTEQMGDVMRAAAQLIGHKVDIYGNDACLMAMAEIAGEVQDSVQYFVGSQEEEPMDGWPYDKFLARWVANPTIGGDQVSQILVEEYGSYYTRNPDPSGMGSTLSAYNMDYFSEFVLAMTSYKGELLTASSTQKEALMTAISYTDSFNDDPDYKDVYSLLKNSKSLNINKAASDRLDQAVRHLVIANQATGSHQGKSYGISVWLPVPADNSDGGKGMPAVHYYQDQIARYKGLKFDQITQWSDLLAAVN